jgi:cytochrome c biogenesis protein ResB
VAHHCFHPDRRGSVDPGRDLAAVGTIVLQRPATEPDEMQNAYSPQVLRILDAVGLTDVFHAWWFLGLLLLVSLCIVAASIDRFPNSWRYFSRPYKYPDESFRRALHPQKSLAIADEESGLVAAERALHSMGFKPERVVREDHFGIFAERHRISELAVYIVHASLLLIFFGTLVDGLWGWRGYLSLNEGQTSNIVQCATAPRARYRLPSAAMPPVRKTTRTALRRSGGRSWPWSADGRDVLKKEIVVNDPLLYSGVRFYQSSYGPNGKVDKSCWSRLRAAVLARSGNRTGGERHVPLDADTTVRFAEFFPTTRFVTGQVYKKSNYMDNPAAHLVVTSKKAGKTSTSGCQRWTRSPTTRRRPTSSRPPT